MADEERAVPHVQTRHALAIFIALTIMAVGWGSLGLLRSAPQAQAGKGLTIRQDEQAGTISVFRAGHGRADPHAERQAGRPALPASDRRARRQGVLTEDSPAHHKHQTGLYWGFTRVNGRDYFHNPHGDYWRRVSATSRRATQAGEEVRWQTVYDLLDAGGRRPS